MECLHRHTHDGMAITIKNDGPSEPLDTENVPPIEDNAPVQETEPTELKHKEARPPTSLFMNRVTTKVVRKGNKYRCVFPGCGTSSITIMSHMYSHQLPEVFHGDQTATLRHFQRAESLKYLANLVTPEGDL